MKKKKILTYGTFDILQSGHINILYKSYELSDELHIEVISKKSSYNGKENLIVNLDEKRLNRIKKIIFVKEVFLDFRNIKKE